MSKIKINIKSTGHSDEGSKNSGDVEKKVVHNLTSIIGYNDDDAQDSGEKDLSNEAIKKDNSKNIDNDSYSSESERVEINTIGNAGKRGRNLVDTIYSSTSSGNHFQEAASKMKVATPAFMPKIIKRIAVAPVKDKVQPNKEKKTFNNSASSRLSNRKTSSPQRKENIVKNTENIKTEIFNKKIVGEDKSVASPVKRRRRKSSNRSFGGGDSGISSLGVNMIMDASEFVGSEQISTTNRRRKYSTRKSSIESKRIKALNKKNADYPSKIDVILPISIQDLGKKLKRKSAEIITWGINSGETKIKNSTVFDDPTMIELICMHFNCAVNVEREYEGSHIFDTSIQEDMDAGPAETVVDRSPVIVLMGHVDHGKTSIIDFYRRKYMNQNKNIIDKEAGKITQSIGAFQVKSDISYVTIIDTPGHSAFSSMREKGAGIADIAIVVVSGEEGVKEQTIESINAVKSIGIPVIIAATKSDLPEFNEEKLYADLAKYELIPEAWGGTVPLVACSSFSGAGMTDLLNAISLQAEVQGIKCRMSDTAKGYVVMSTKDSKKGSSVSVILKNGSLSQGDVIVSPSGFGRIKIMKDQDGKVIKTLNPSCPAEIFGFGGLPQSGEEFKKVKNLSVAKDIYESCKTTEDLDRSASYIKHKPMMNPEDILSVLKGEKEEEAAKQEINIIVKSASHGMLSAVLDLIAGISFKNTEIKVIAQGVGSITVVDYETALNCNAVLCGFQVKFIDDKIRVNAEKANIRYVVNDVIYRIAESMVEIAKERVCKKITVEQKATLEIVMVFKSSKLGKIAGCNVLKGTIERNHFVNILNSKGEAKASRLKMSSMKTEKKNINSAIAGTECGILTEGFDDFEIGDKIETFVENYVDGDI